MTSEKDANYSEAYVCIWLPAATEPVIAGLLTKQGEQLVFNYGRSYLARQGAIPIYGPELPLRPGILELLPGLNMPGCIRDASPDAWGRRVLINRKLGSRGEDANQVELGEFINGGQIPIVSDLRELPGWRGTKGDDDERYL